MSTPRFVVRPHDPRRATLRVAVIVVAAVLVALALFEAGRVQGGHAHDERRALDGELQRLERETGELRTRLAAVERSGQVDQRAYADLRGLLREQNEEILSLREELAFYRGIVSPVDSRRGLRVHGFRVEPMGGTRAWRFRLVLIQAMQHDRQAQGTARITLVGSTNGTPARLPLSDVGEHPADGIAYDFRYFQEFDGDILLPEGFTPNRVEVELVARAARDGRVEQVFDWAAAQ